jgi:hypothetical protein
MEYKRCPVFVDGKECSLPLIQIDHEVRFNLVTYKCDLGHRSWVFHFRSFNNAEEPAKPPPDEDEPNPPIKEPPTEEPPVKEPPPKNA